MNPRFDIVIVGAGMAGASLAATLGDGIRVLMIETEERPGYHATGRSAAFWTESYGGPAIQPLTTASGAPLHELGVLAPRAALTIGRGEQARRVASFAKQFRSAGVAVEELDRTQLEPRIPGLRSEWVHGVLEPSTCDIDVAALHQAYLARAAGRGAELRCRSALVAVDTRDKGWTLTLADGQRIDCEVLVNAAGAWADPVARLAGVRPLGFTPYRRTIAQITVDAPVPDDLPLVLDIDEKFYFKPEHGRIWVSPHDETPSEPCDAAPEELDVALAIHRLEQVVDWPVLRVEHRWAGLRTFAPDRVPVFGFDSGQPSFFWFAGQGGFGIQTAPAAAEIGARLLRGEAAGPLDPAPFSPSRFV